MGKITFRMKNKKGKYGYVHLENKSKIDITTPLPRKDAEKLLEGLKRILYLKEKK